MKLNFFTPTSKVHTQRNVMREIDERLARYSKRGVLLSIAIFAVAIYIGEYYKQQPSMALVLSAGLLFISLFRAYFLIRFDALYAKGPNRWRNLFFIFSLLGSTWWGFILANVTYTLGLEYETPMLWFYTITFFASSIYVFAPYERFLTLYMFVCFIPSAAVAVYLFEPLSISYGTMMLILFLMLSRQGRIISKTYWDKLEANYQLMQRANALEAEKITSESSLNDRDTLFRNLTQEVKVSLQEILGSLQLLKYSQLECEEEQLVVLAEQKTQQQISMLKNVAELTSIAKKELLLDQHVIDPRYHIEQALSNVSIVAHKKNIELYSSFASDFPLRVRGDTERLEQLIGNLINSACQFANDGELIVSSSFRFDQEPTLLKISIINHNPIRTPEAIDSINNAFSPHFSTNMHLGLSLAIVKGLANCMGGDAGVAYRDDGSLVFWISVSLLAVSNNTSAIRSVTKLAGKQVLLFEPPSAITTVFSHTLESWGLITDVFDDEEKAFSALKSKKYDLVIIYTRLNNLDSLNLSRMIAEDDDIWRLPQIVTLSKLQNKLPEVESHFSKYVNVQVIYKPLRQRRLHKIVKGLLVETTEDKSLISNKEDFLSKKEVLLFQQEDIDMAIAKKMLSKLGCTVSSVDTIGDALELLEERPFDVFISESHLDDINLEEFVEKAKNSNDQLRESNYNIPILGLSSREKDGEETHCLILIHRLISMTCKPFCVAG